MSKCINLILSSKVSQYSEDINPNKYSICTYATLAFLFWVDRELSTIKVLMSLTEDANFDDIFRGIIENGYAIFINNYPDGELQREGIDFDEVYEKNSELIYELMKHYEINLKAQLFCPDNDIDNVLTKNGDIIVVNISGETVAFYKCDLHTYMYFDPHKNGDHNPPGFAIIDTLGANKILHITEFSDYWMITRLS